MVNSRRGAHAAYYGLCTVLMVLTTQQHWPRANTARFGAFSATNVDVWATAANILGTVLATGGLLKNVVMGSGESSISAGGL